MGFSGRSWANVVLLAGVDEDELPEDTSGASPSTVDPPHPASVTVSAAAANVVADERIRELMMGMLGHHPGVPGSHAVASTPR